jgi:hypothetical protein
MDHVSEISGSLYAYFFRGHPVFAAICVTVVVAAVVFITTFVLAKKYENQHPQTAKNEIEFLCPYQAASTATPDGGVDVSNWWIPIKLAPEKQPISNATVRLKWHNAYRHGHNEDQKLWWVHKKDKTTSEIELVPGVLRMINFVARRVPSGDDRGWYAVLLEESSAIYPTEHKETVKFPAGEDQRMTVTVLASGKELGSETYIVHVPPKGEHNTRFWISTPELDNW